MQVDVPPNMTRLLYFDEEALQLECLALLLAAQGYSSQIAQYKMDRQLGDGAFSQVGLGRHRHTGEKFAIKIISAAKATGNQNFSLKREVELHQRCRQCPNIVRFKEKFQVGDFHYIVMEYVKGGDLQQYFAARDFRPMPLELVRSITLQIANALVYLRKQRIIHRDIKLENILLSNFTEQCKAKLIDFGLAETLHSQAKTGSRAGTMGYVAPEILAGGLYDLSVDVWSLGCLLYVMLTMMLPFQQ